MISLITAIVCAVLLVFLFAPGEFLWSNTVTRDRAIHMYQFSFMSFTRWIPENIPKGRSWLLGAGKLTAELPGARLGEDGNIVERRVFEGNLWYLRILGMDFEFKHVNTGDVKAAHVQEE